MAEQKINKVIFGDEVLINLENDTVTPEKLALGATAHDKTGNIITGTSTKDSDTSDATAAEDEVLEGKTAYVRGVKITGTMPNIGAAAGTISNIDTPYTISMGFHDGSGTVSIDETEKAKIIGSNIREGVTILGVEGTMSGSEDEKPQENKEATPKKGESQTILPDTGFTCLRQVTVKPIPYSETPNAAGGITATIAGV